MQRRSADAIRIEEKQKREYRRARRKIREAAGEIKELNIVAMMDMMTILLVFLLKSYQTSTINVNMGEHLTLPASTTQLAPQENITITLSMDELTVNDRRVLALEGGAIPAREKEGGKADAFYVGVVYDALKREVDKQKYIAQFNKTAPFSGRVNLVADKKITYRTLMEVLYTAGQAELGEYKFMVLKNSQ
ncbi:MAG TPA: biopolymer transporter ExbD [Anaeromyxobacteraceae bacterium]|nr:biopolymer transporter ExbD [Anaeromyxobacteraceae bacterium]